MSCPYLSECIRPGTPQSIRDWILFTDRHHQGDKTPSQTIKSYRGTEIALYIDFKKVSRLRRESRKREELQNQSLSFYHFHIKMENL
jgi:hypothetical protein